MSVGACYDQCDADAYLCQRFKHYATRKQADMQHSVSCSSSGQVMYCFWHLAYVGTICATCNCHFISLPGLGPVFSVSLSQTKLLILTCRKKKKRKYTELHALHTSAAQLPKQHFWAKASFISGDVMLLKIVRISVNFSALSCTPVFALCTTVTLSSSS